MLWQSLPRTHLTDAAAVIRLRELIHSPSIQSALLHSSDTMLAFALRAVEHVVADQSQTDREIIARLWDILDDPQLNQALGITQNARFMLNSKETLTPRLYPPCSVRLPSISVLEIWSVVKCRMTTSTFLAEHRDC